MNEKSDSKLEQSSEKFFCRFCKRGFHTVAQRKRHTELLCQKKRGNQLSTGVDPSFKCDKCGKMFISKAGRTTHILHVHGGQKADVQVKSEANVMSTADAPEKDCYVNMARTNQSRSTSPEDMGSPSDVAKRNVLEENPVRSSSSSCMCDCCGEILPNDVELAAHIEDCKVSMSLESLKRKRRL